MYILSKRIIAAFAFAAFVILALPGCTVTRQSKDMVIGSGTVGRQEVIIEKALAGIRVKTAIDVVLDGSLSDKAVIEADDNILSLVTVNQDISGVLEIDFQDNTNISPVKPVIVYVPLLSGGLLETLSAGNISMKDDAQLVGDFFELHLASAGDISVRLKAGSIKAAIESSGSLSLQGEADHAEIILSSAGDFNGFDFQIKDASVFARSSGNAYVNASGILKAEVTSAGNIVYDGKPGSIEMKDTSAGAIRPR